MAPKKNKACRNAFYFFMMDVKQRQGRNFRNMQEVSEAAGSMWNNMSASEKEPYETMARREKQTQKDVKYTSLGVNIDEVKRQENELKQKEQHMRQDTQKIVQLLMQTDNIAIHFFHIIHINNFCCSTMHKRNYPAEIGVSRFNLLEGVDSEKVFHRIIKPGPLPLGYSYQAKKLSEETHQLPPPAGPEAPDNTEEIVENLMAYLMEIDSDLHDGLPPMFARERDLAFITQTLETFALDFGKREDLFKVYSLEYFLYILRNAVAEQQVWPVLSLSAEVIERDVYDFTLNIACEYHQSIDVPVHCSKAIVTRFAYAICDNCCQYLGIDLVPGRHIPSKAKLSAFSRANTSYASSIADDQESTVSYKSAVISESDRCNSTLSFVSTHTVFDDNDFPALGGNKRNNTADSDLYPTARNSNRNSRKPVELPSALTDRMDGLSFQQQQQQSKPKGRGRGIVKKSTNRQ